MNMFYTLHNPQNHGYMKYKTMCTLKFHDFLARLVSTKFDFRP